MILPAVLLLVAGLLAVIAPIRGDAPSQIALTAASVPPACVNDRFTQCRRTPFTWRMRQNDPASGPVVGTVSGNLTLSAGVRTGERRWKLHYRFEVTALTDLAATGTVATIAVECRTECTLPFATAASPAVDVPLTQRSVIDGDVDVVSSTSMVAESYQRVDLFLTNPGAVGVGTTRGATGNVLGPVRCDSGRLTDTGDDPPPRLGLARPGCVYPEFTPTFVVNGPESSPNLFAPQNADFVAEAQAALGGLGNPRSGAPLHREGVEAVKKRNRANACRDFVRLRDRDDSCDEYPFASTKESAAVTPFTGHVDRPDNEAGGIQYSQFIANYRLLDGDAFFVEPLFRRTTG